MNKTCVVVIGGGATGIGILRDLSMRGIAAVLLEQGGLAHGTSSRFHGLLHSGARYAVDDIESARECIEENTILRRIGRHCVEKSEGFFVRTEEDDPAYDAPWLEACAKAGIAVSPCAVEEARRLEPALSPFSRAVYRVPDSGVDGFRLIWHNSVSARKYGGVVRTHHTVVGIRIRGGAVAGVDVRDTLKQEHYTLFCDYIVNAAGPWAGEVAGMAGLSVAMRPDRGTLLVFNHRFTSRVINRLHKSADGDIFVPHGLVTIFGTTSAEAEYPGDTRPRSEEVQCLLRLGKTLFPDIRRYRILRAFAGNRPLYAPPDSGAGRGASRTFVIVDHKRDGLSGMASIFGGKLTTYRLMAEKMSDLVCLSLPAKAHVQPILYHAPCHLRARGIGLPALDLLREIPGLSVHNADMGCCGIAGSYGFKADKYAISMQVGEKLFAVIKDSAAAVCTSECGACRVQMRHGGQKPVLHPISLLKRQIEG